MKRQHFDRATGSRRLAAFCALGLVMAACGGSDSTTTSAGAAPTSTAAESATTAAVTTSVPVADELPPICSLIEAGEMAAILGTDVTIDDTFPFDCYYETQGGLSGALDSQTSVFAASREECALFLPTEATLPGQTIEPAPDYGDLATLATSELFAEFGVCSDGLAISVKVRGGEGSSPEKRLGAARAILDLLLERV